MVHELWTQLRVALFMTVPMKLSPLAAGSLAEAAADHGGGGVLGGVGVGVGVGGVGGFGDIAARLRKWEC